MDCSRRRVLECIACASERCKAIDTLYRNHVHNKLMEGPNPAHKVMIRFTLLGNIFGSLSVGGTVS